jgi:hypothetical protein
VVALDFDIAAMVCLRKIEPPSEVKILAEAVAAVFGIETEDA